MTKTQVRIILAAVAVGLSASTLSAGATMCILNGSQLASVLAAPSQMLFAGKP